jgi:hypothetical protein
MIEESLDDLIIEVLLDLAGDTLAKCNVKTELELLQLEGTGFDEMVDILTGYNQAFLDGSLDDIPLRALSLLVAIEFTKIQVGNRNN